MFDMTPYEMYVFTLCCIVFSIFTVLFSVMIGYLISLHLKLIRHGILDEKIITEYQKQREDPPTRFGKFMDYFIAALVCVAMCAVFAFSLMLKVNENKIPENMTALKVVQSSSMATKHEKNTHLNGVDNQVQMFDLIVVHRLPDEMDLQVNDIVLYEIDGDLVLHRIVKIEEPNATHPDQRWFTFQGDAVPSPDRGPVGYVQMKAIYRNQSIPMVGSFVMFMQSPAGYLCILLILIAMIATPILERVLENAKRERLRVICATRCVRTSKLVAIERAIYAYCGRNFFCRFMGFFYWRWLKKRLNKS